MSDEAHLDGLSDGDKNGAAEAARAAGLDGWLIELTNTTQQPPVAVLHHRATRQRVYEAGIARGLGGEHDTRGVLLDIVRVSGERARLLGFAHHAAYAAEDGCAGSTEAVNDILGRLGPATFDLMRVRAEAWQQRLEQIEPGASVEPWDVLYLSELISSEEKSLDGAALRPYLEFDRVLEDGVFAAAEGLYGLTFHRRADLVGYSFVQTPEDIAALQSVLAELAPARWRQLGIVAKIETPLAVRNLPQLIVRAAGRQPLALMIARGDLAVEIGFERLAEMQEEILWLAEAAHVPVIWATQVLESLVKQGLPSRGEMTDAAMAARGHGWMAEARGAVVGHLRPGGMSQSVLPAAMGISKQAVQQLVDELVAEGIVERIPDPADGRGKIVRRAISSAERANVCGVLAVKAWRAVGVAARAVRPRMGQDFNDVAREEGGS